MDSFKDKYDLTDPYTKANINDAAKEIIKELVVVQDPKTALYGLFYKRNSEGYKQIWNFEENSLKDARKQNELDPSKLNEGLDSASASRQIIQKGAKVMVTDLSSFPSTE